MENRNNRWAGIYHHALRRGVALIAIALSGGIMCATLVRFSPGFGVDQRELDSRLNADSLTSIRNSHAKNRSVLTFYAGYLNGMLHGDFGMSETLQRPIGELMQERVGVSIHSLAVALPTAWILVFAVAMSITGTRNTSATVFSGMVAGGLLSTPAAMIALWAASSGRGSSAALIIILAPALYRYTHNILERSFRKAHVVAARARGIGPLRIMAWHVLPTAAPQIIGLVAVSISMAFGALIPVEFICDSPGMGQLALQAALGRDLPLLVTVTMAVTIVTFLANATADAVNEAMTPISA